MRLLFTPYMLAMLWLAAYVPIASADVKQDVQQFLDRGDFKGALDMIEQGLEKDVTDQKLLLAKGYLLVKLNQLDAATEYYKILKAHLTDNPEPGNNLAMIYRMRGEYELAIQTFEQIIEAFPDYAHAYENLGDTYIELALNKYQAGFDSSGRKSLQKKLALSQKFHQIAIDSSAKPTQESQQIANTSKTTSTSSDTNTADESSQAPSAEADKSKERIVKSIETWIKDWMSQDADRYLSHYSDKFTPGKNEPLARWIKRKKNILLHAKNIKLKLSDLDIMLNPDKGLATAKFKQEYESNNFKDVSKKTLHLEQNKGRWLILKEVSESA